MKYAIFLLDGAADKALIQFRGNTPLIQAVGELKQEGKFSNLEWMVRRSCCGTLRTISDEMEDTGSTTANLSVLGYDPMQVTGSKRDTRAAFEAKSIGIDLADDEVAFRCNLICVDKDGKIKNHSAGHITNEESRPLVETLNDKLKSDKVRFYPGVSYRHILVLKGNEFSKDVVGTPPHDYIGHHIDELSITGDKTTVDFLYDLSAKATEILSNHWVNINRFTLGKDMATHTWYWAAAKKPNMFDFEEAYGVRGAMVCAVDLIKGIGKYAGFDIIEVEGATGGIETNFAGKGYAAAKALKDHDFVYVHLEAPDEAGHTGGPDKEKAAKAFMTKVQTLKNADQLLMEAFFSSVPSHTLYGGLSVAVLPDHATPCSVGTHTKDPVPVMIYNPRICGDNVTEYSERAVVKGRLGRMNGNDFIRTFLSR